MKEWGTTVAAITRLLKEEGGLTRAEVCDRLGLDRRYVSAVITRMNKPGAVTPKRIYITHYVHDNAGERRYPRAVYDLGDKPDAKKPKSDLKAIRQRYRERQRGLLKGNSVFNLGLTRRQLKEQRGTLSIGQ